MQDAVGIDIEGHFNLLNAARRRRNPIEMECPQVLVITRKWALPLQDLDLHPRLIVAVGRKNLRFTSWDRGIARNHRRSHAAGGFNRQGKRGNVEEENVLGVSFGGAALNSWANRDYLVRILALVRFLAI